MTAFLTNDDVSRLLADPSPAARVDAASKIAIGFNSGSFSQREHKLAEEIFRIMVSDAEIRVREAIAINLKNNPAIPHDVAQALANDVRRVALPILTYCEVLTDEDLIEIIRSHDEGKQIAIAGRVFVSEIISDSLINTKNENVVCRLVGNEGARISDMSFDKAVNTLGDSHKVQTAMIGRSSLPVTVAEKLVTKVSDVMRDQLLSRHPLTANTTMDLLLQSRERATVNLSSQSSAPDIRKLVKQLHQHGRLTPSLVVRALCMGDLRFFEFALSELANIPLINAQVLIHDPGHMGLQRLWTASNMPEQQLKTVQAAIAALSELEHDGEAHDRERFSRRLIERILSQYEEQGVVLEADDLEYLLSRMADPLAANHPTP
ncbi:MAG: DUF2336 domain-containing protein [Rhodospirillales bacterium]|nr:DUF2336 domain-containing protein [Rhodospirillales bacterium]